MPVLPSFINYGKGKRKFKVPTKYPFISSRHPVPALFPPPSSEVIEINDSSTSQLEDEEFVSKGSLDSDFDEHRYHYEPLDLNISPEPLMSAFPPQFLKNSYIQPLNTIPPRICSNGEEDGGMRLGSTSAENNGFDTEDEDAEELIAKLQGMDASSFVGGPSPSGSPPFASTFNYNASASRRRSMKKAMLAPIQIQTTGERETSQQRESSQPHSQISSPASSAVSGTTLARALISNTFVLSIDTRDSRKYRSGVSTLTRTDSATLPMGDHPFLSSLRGRDGRTSRDGLPWYNGDVPPVPPMPSEAELLLLASKTTSPHSGLTRRKTGGFRRSSTGSLDLSRSPELSGPVASSEIPITAVIDSVSASSVHASRRISRITEGTASAPETPIFRDFDTEDENTAEMVLPDSPQSLPGNFDNATEEVRKPLPPVPGSTFTIPNRTGEEAEASAREVDNVIDFYSGFSPEAHQTGFKPAFSPITEVSETSGLSPLISPFRKPYSERSSSFSPLSPEYGVIHKDSASRFGSDPQHHAHLPVRDAPRPSAPPKRYRYSASFSNMPAGSSVRQIYTRKRSGSAPSPIVIVPDPYDLNNYRVTMSPDSHDVLSHPTGDSATQTFPETPYSPVWSPLGPATTSITARLQDDRDTRFPRTPESGSLSAFGNMQTSLTQAMLMARAASGARHSRQSSVTRNRDRKGSVSQESEEKNDVKIDDGNTSSAQPADRHVSLSGPRKNPAAAGSSSFSIRSYTGSNDGQASRPSSRDAASKRSSLAGSVNMVNSKLGEHQNRRRESSSITAGEETSSSGNIYLNISRNASQSSKFSPVETQNSPNSFQTPSASQYIATARPSLASNSSAHSLSPILDSTDSFLTHAENVAESPPAYDTVFGDRLASDSRTPSTAGFDFPSYRPPHNTGESQSRDSLITGSLNNQRQRQRQRPRLPAGPRDRRDGRTASQTGRERNGSVSSVASTLPSGIPRAPAPPMQSPHFDVPSPKFKGLTMEAAKWTFTSAELQAIVSRAIQQSAEALSIRLLHLDTLDHDIPEDLARLESERRDIQVKYRSLFHRRNKLLDCLSNSSGPQTAESLGSTSRIAESLKEVSSQLDKLTEDLHSVDEQLSHLNILVVKHSSSALAMALRKLNKSFLEKLSELERVRHEMVGLEAERNDAVKQAEEAALKASNSGSATQRRPSVRRFKAGLYSPSRPSSYYSNRASIASVLTANIKSPTGPEDLPPVPPIPSNPAIPRRRIPDQIRVDAPMRSANPLSATFTPPTPDTRALLEQEELYFDIERHIGTRLRRSRSFGTLLSNADPSRRPRSPLRRNGSVGGSRRPASLPGDSRLSDAYRAMNADSNAMLLTLRMLSDTV